MPRLDGIEALKRIHTFDPGIRVVVLTGSGDPAVHQEARKHGASEVCTKPYDADALAQIVGQGRVPLDR